jgi:hypothetical protein
VPPGVVASAQRHWQELAPKRSTLLAINTELSQNFRKITRAVTKVLSRAGELVCDGEEEIGKRNVIAISGVGAMSEPQILATAEDDGVICGFVCLAGRTSVETKCVV